MTKSDEFTRFDRTMRELMSVPHSEIKAALDEEKAAKKRRPRRTGKGKNDKRDQNSNRPQ
jgi:hypothetical protein